MASSQGQVGQFERHFAAQSRGLIPYSSGFTVIGKIGGSRSGSYKNKSEPGNAELISISPSLAAVEQAVDSVGAGHRRRKKRKSTKRRGVRRKKPVKRSGGRRRKKRSGNSKRLRRREVL